MGTCEFTAEIANGGVPQAGVMQDALPSSERAANPCRASLAASGSERRTHGRSLLRRQIRAAICRVLLGGLLFGYLALPIRAEPPKATALFPAGVQQGQTVAVAVEGTDGAWPVQIWTSDSCVQARVLEEKGKIEVTAAADAVPGVYWLRFFNEDGATSLRPFLVGTVAEMNENEPNDSLSDAQVVESTPVVVNGILRRSGDVDTYAVKLAAGQTLVASIEANCQLGSDMDGLLQIVSRAGFVLEQNDEYHDLDPQIVFTAPDDGIYLVRTFAFPATPTSRIDFAGDEAYVYRLTLTTGGFADHAWPLAVTTGGTPEVTIEGWNIPDDAQSLTAARVVDSIARFAHPELASTVDALVEPTASAVETEPNDEAHPVDLPFPATVTGRIDSAGDVDVYRFQATKGQAMRFQVESRELGFPLDPVLRVLNAAGEERKRVDDSSRRSRDAELDFTAPDDGPLLVEVSDLYGDGGFRYVYRLRAIEPKPDYALRVEEDHFALVVGKPLEIKVDVDRKDGFKQAIQISAEGLPEGVTLEPINSPSEGDAAKSVKVKLTGAAPTAGGPIRIVGRVEAQPDFERTATARLEAFHTTTSELWLTVLKAEEKDEAKSDEKSR